jgi:hypothetical protein
MLWISWQKKGKHNMNLYLIRNDVNRRHFDVYRAAIVAAESEEQARYIHPDGGKNGLPVHEWSYDWCDPQLVDVRLIGIATTNEVGVILADFLEP